MSGIAAPSGSATQSTNAATYAGPAPGVWTGPKRYNRAKLEPYECGIEPTRQPPGDGTISVRYFIIAMLFIGFDIEIIFQYPFAVAFDSLGWFGLIEMSIFMATVYVAYAYLWHRVTLVTLEWN